MRPIDQTVSPNGEPLTLGYIEWHVSQVNEWARLGGYVNNLRLNVLTPKTEDEK